MRALYLYLMILATLSSMGAATDTTRYTGTTRIAVTEKPRDPNHHEPSYFEKYVKPKSIKALISYCETQWMQQDKDSFCSMPEKVAVNHYHYWSDSWISGMRVYLLSDSAIALEFQKLKIPDINDQWRFILTSLHREINKKRKKR